MRGQARGGPEGRTGRAVSCPGPHLRGSRASQPQPNVSQRQPRRGQGHQEQPEGVAELQDSPSRLAGVKQAKPLRLTADPAAPHRRRHPTSSSGGGSSVPRPRASAAAPAAPHAARPSPAPQSPRGLGAPECPVGVSPPPVFRSHPNTSASPVCVFLSASSDGVGRCAGHTAWGVVTPVLDAAWDVAGEEHVLPCGPARWDAGMGREHLAKTRPGVDTPLG